VACANVRFSGEVLVFKGYDWSRLAAGKTAGVESIAFAPDGSEMMVLAAGLFMPRGLQFWDTSTWSKTSELKDISRAVYIPDESGILAVRDQGLVLRSGTLTVARELDHADLFSLSADGKALVSMGGG
jgi:hypothetical protein